MTSMTLRNGLALHRSLLRTYKAAHLQSNMLSGSDLDVGRSSILDTTIAQML